MAIFIRSGDTRWCGGLRWVAYMRKPGFFALRRNALDMGMTHFIRSRDLPRRAGFMQLVADTASTRKINSLLVAVIRKYGARSYIELEIGPDQTWFAATDDDASPLPGSDQIYTDEEMAGMRTALTGWRFETRELATGEKGDAFLSGLPPSPLTVHSISLRPLCLGLASLAVLGGTALEAYSVVHERQLRHFREEARRTFLLQRQKAEAAARNAQSPGEWVRMCMANGYHLPAYTHGWTLNRWECVGNELDVEWTRSGGTLADAPHGDVRSNGNIVSGHLPLLPVEAHEPPSREAAADSRQFISYLQASGVTPTITQSGLSGTTAGHALPQSFSISFTWQSDPRAVPWDTFAGLHMERLARVVAAGGEQTGKTLEYLIKIRIDDTPAH
ncbi:type 4b pilus protein PilO2 (plasmid) [Acetobacter vaccinii]|uniref:Type 4b pilus protein PilO2 n=2 Tax=Acetobacter vaccinii TaxID=2592655 RepID=A0A5C1YSZ5_9PROT|nr:type 4b pilus protein PilO2 [Acetobacter vaccinii]